MVVLNKKGKLLAKKGVDITSFPAALLAGVLKGKLYQLIENDEGDWEVRVNQVLDPDLLR